MKRNMVLWLVVMAVTACVVQAEVQYWHDNGIVSAVDANEWDDADNWGGGVVPDFNTMAIMWPNDAIWPEVDSVVPTINILAVAWHSTGWVCEFNMLPGGHLEANTYNDGTDHVGFIRLGNNANSFGVINQSGGYLGSPNVQIGMAGGIGQVNLTGGELYTGGLHVEPNGGYPNGSYIDLAGGILTLPGDVISYVPAFLLDERIVGYGNTGGVSAVYDSGTDMTTVEGVDCSRPQSDLNKDCVVDLSDFAIMAAQWLL